MKYHTLIIGLLCDAKQKGEVLTRERVFRQIPEQIRHHAQTTKDVEGVFKQLLKTKTIRKKKNGYELR